MMESRYDYAREHLQALYKMRRQDQLCNVIIEVERRKFRAHKAVLAATGDYFLTMFTSGFRESSAQEITIEGCAAAFEILLNFVYTGKVDRTKVVPCMYEVLEMACYMQFTEFAEICSSAIKNLLKTATEEFSVSDVCKVMLLAQTHIYLSSLYKATLKYLEDKVESLKSLDMFLENVSATFLQEFLGRENLSTASEEEHVLELVINWLKHDWEKRNEYSHQLLQKVRLGLVLPVDIKKLIGPEILNIPGCSEYVQRVLDLQASKKPMEALAIENPDIAASRSNVTAPVMTTSQGKMRYYDVEHKKWVGMKKMDPLPSNKYELIVVNGILYAAGGSGGKEFLKYEAGENKWVTLPSKPLGRSRIQLVALGAYIYAFSACCESDEVFMIERYYINTKKWEVLKKAADESKSDYSTSKFNMDAMDTTKTMNFDHWHFRKDRSYYNFALVFEGKIYVSSLEQKCGDSRPSRHYLVEKLTIFDPNTNTCQVSDLYLDSSRREEEHGWWKRHYFKPTLFIYKEFLYRMIVEFASDECPVYVSKVSLTYGEDGRIIVRLDKELRPGLQLYQIPDDGDAPFYIQDQISVEGSSKRSKASGGDKVRSFPQYGENKQLMCTNDNSSKYFYPVWFSFEKKKLTVPKKKKEWEFSDDDEEYDDDDDEEEEEYDSSDDMYNDSDDDSDDDDDEEEEEEDNCTIN